MSNTYLTEEEDGQVVRLASGHMLDGLRLLRAYIDGYIRDVRRKKGTALHYIDLWAGPGKARFSPGGMVLLTSPLIALTASNAFDHYYFAEAKRPEHEALKARVRGSKRAAQVTLYRQDGNEAVDSVVAALAASSGQHVAFLAADNLQLQWSSIEKLVQVAGMELIIDVSRSGLGRDDNLMHNAEKLAQMDNFYGSSAWRKVYQQVARQDEAEKRRALLEYYIECFAMIGCVPMRQIASSSKRAYTFIATSQTLVRDALWDAALQHIRQKRLL